MRLCSAFSDTMQAVTGQARSNGSLLGVSFSFSALDRGAALFAEVRSEEGPGERATAL